MSLVNRRPRPLKRDSTSLRDDRLFIIACDDTYAPAQYFGMFKVPRVRIHVVPTIDGTSSARHVLDRLLSFEHEDYDERWLVLDTDHYDQGTHLASFVAALREANAKGIQVALSKPCFELWLLLHLVEEDAVTEFVDANAVAVALSEKLGHYNKTRLVTEDFKPHVDGACQRAERLDKSIMGGDIPQGNTSRVYLLCNAIRNSLRYGVTE